MSVKLKSKLPTAVAHAIAVSLLAASAWSDEVTYNRDVRPILSDKCFACHGPDDEDREADLRLDIRPDAIEAGALEPGDSDASELVMRIASDDPDTMMPPPSANKPLSETEKQTLRQWVAAGAEYQRHWAFEPLEDVEVPTVRETSWCRTPIDAFILRALDREGLSPSPQADRHTLIRRVYLDLIGLLPSPDQVDSFVNDDSPRAYERLIDSLLESKHYGERWGRHWLDQARYADSNGYTFDNARTMWPYRDWVINAINSDMPFDQFTIEQLAGDLLPEPTMDQLIATGFHRNTLINEEGGTDDEQFRVESVIDRTNTTGSVWLALTVGCAQCHHHKFDPISQQDYYGLYAFFNSTEDKNNRGPEVIARDPHADRIREIDQEIAALKAAVKKKPADPKVIEWTALHAVGHDADSGAQFESLNDQSLLVSGANAVEDAYHIRYEIEPQQIAALRLDVLPHESLPKKGPGRASNGNFVLADIQLKDAKGNLIPLNKFANADYSQNGHHVSRAVDNDPHTGWAINTNGKGNVAHWAHVTLKEPTTIDEASHLQLTLSFWQGTQPYNLGRFLVSVSPGVPPGEDPAQAKIVALATDRKAVEAKRTKAMVMRELSNPRPSHVLIRGDFLRPGDPVTPRTLSDLHPMAGESETLNRLDLARWIVDSANPITPRVVVNRVWQKYFGTGIVETVEDFGSQGSPPTHPELLDWMARQFVASGWSMKQLHRLIVTSAVYRQASTSRGELTAADPLNKLLGRQHRLRVDSTLR